jgi:hypothetical protein
MRKVQVPEEIFDATLGSYVTGPLGGSWRCRPRNTFLLRGRSRHPTPEQLALWREAQQRLPELIEQAIASIPPPPPGGDPLFTFDRTKCELDELRLEQDGSMAFFFTPTIVLDGYQLCPLVIFKGWQITESYWAP